MHLLFVLFLVLSLISGCAVQESGGISTNRPDLCVQLSTDINQTDVVVVKGVQDGNAFQYTASGAQKDTLKTVAHMFSNGSFRHSLIELESIAMILREGHQLFGWDLDGEFIVEFYVDTKLVFDMYFLFDVNWSQEDGVGECSFNVLVNEDIEVVKNLDSYDIPSHVVLSGNLNQEWNEILRRLIIRSSLSENPAPRKP